MCIGLLAKRDYYERNVFRNAELKRLTNSQPGDKISTFSKLFNLLLKSSVATGGCLHSLLRDGNLFDSKYRMHITS